MMRVKKILAVLLIGILGSQSLPVRQIGYFLYNNALNEEIPHDMIPVSPETAHWTTPPEPDFTGIHSHLSDAYIGAYIHAAVSLPANHSGDIHTPPPNC